LITEVSVQHIDPIVKVLPKRQ